MTAGEIYFLQERHPRTGMITDYCKIGIVRDAENRTSESRAKEHQTGNPRLLEVAEIVKSEIVEAVETTLHNLHAPWRLSGEWFFLSPAQRAAAVAEARRLAREATVAAADMRIARDLRSTASVGDTVPASDEALEVLARLTVQRARLRDIGAVIKSAHTVLRPYIDAQGGTSRLGSIIVRRGADQFDEASFKASHSDLYRRYLITENKTSGVFRTAGADWDGSFADATALAKELDGLREAPEDERAEAAHDAYLRSIAVETVAEWEIAALEARLKVLCGTAPGIVGVCTWNRAEKESSRLDKSALKKEHADVYETFTTRKGDTSVLVLAKDRGFRH